MPDPCGEIPLEALEAARAAALLGESFSLQVLADAGVAANQLDSLFDEGVLVQDSDIHASFANVACRKQLLKEIPWSFRRSWSLKLGERLELLKGNPEDIGRLFIAAQLFDRAKPHLIKGAEKACLCNDYLKALSLLRQVFDIWKENEDPTARMKLLREMARCAANTTDYDTAVIAWEEILENAHAEDNLEVQIEAHQQLAQWTGIMGRRQSVREHLQLAAELAGKLDDPASEARQWFEFAGFQVTHVRLASANEALERAYQAILESDEPALRIEIMATRALGQAMVGNTEKAFAWIDETLNYAIQQELPEQVTYVYRRMANIHEYSGNFQAYLDLELKALDRCRTDEHGDLEQACLSCLSYAFFRCGHWKRSQEMVRLVLDELNIQGELRLIALGTRSAIAAFRGEKRTFDSSRKQFEDLVRICGGAYMHFHVIWSAGILADLEGDSKTADQEFSELIELWRDTEDRHDVVPGMVSACSFYADCNQSNRLAECIDILNTICSENNNNESRSARSAALAEAAWIKGRIDQAIDLLNEAIAGYEVQKTPLEIALLTRRLGKMHLSKEDAKLAREAFSRSEGIARSLGLRPLLQVIQREQSAPSVPTEGKAQVSGLTRRQKEVLKLIADGLTNKEIAAALSLSPRTVEMHVGSILERLNCRARTDAIKRAVELGLV